MARLPIAALLAAVFALPAPAAETVNPLTDSETWDALRPDITGDAAIAPAGGLFTVDAPYRAEDAATVPLHIVQTDPSVPIDVNLAKYGEPARLYCPAGVYEVLYDEQGQNPKFQINFQNCVHCKTCDIKDPSQNIDWTTPQGGDGPNYPNM